MKILYITNMFPTTDYPHYGIFVKEQIDSIQKVGELNSDVFFINPRKSKFEYLRAIFAIPRFLRKSTPDVIHVHHYFCSLFLLFLKPRNTKLILTLHGSDVLQNFKNLFLKKLSIVLLKKFHTIIVVSDEIASFINKELDADVRVIPCGVNTEIFYHQKGDEIIDVNQITMLFPSNPERPEKNFKLFKSVVTELKSMINKRVKEIYLDGFSRKEMADILNNSDLLLMTSTHEGSPQIIKEALACNMRIVSTPVGDVSNQLSGVKNCKVTLGYCEQEIAEAVKNCLEDKIKGNKGEEQIKLLAYDDITIAKKIHSVYLGY